MELLRVPVILAAFACSMGASIIPETSTSPVETFTTAIRHESSPDDNSDSFDSPRRLINASKYHSVQYKRHIRDKKSVPTDPPVGCFPATEARGAPYILCEDPSTINTVPTSHMERNEDAVKVDKGGDEKIDKDGDGKFDKEGDEKLFSGILSGSGAGLHTSVFPNTLPEYFGVHHANLGPAYGGVHQGFLDGGYPSSSFGGYAVLNPGYTGCQQSPFYPGSSLRPYSNFVQPLTPIAPTSYFYKPVSSIPIAAPTVDVSSHLYKHTANTETSYGGFEQFSGQKANQYSDQSINPSGPFMPTQFAATQEAIRHSQMNSFNPLAYPVGFGQFSEQPTDRHLFPATSESIRQFPEEVFNSMASHDSSAQFSAQQEAVRSQIGRGNSRTSSLNHIDLPALPQIQNYLPTMQLPTGQFVRSSVPGLSAFPQRGNAYCGGIPLLASCTPNLIMGKLIQNGHGGYGVGMGVYGNGHLNKVYGGSGTGLSAPWFGGSPYGSVYYRASEDNSDSLPILQDEERVYKRVFTPLEKSSEPQKEPTKYEEKTDEKFTTKE